MSNKKSMLACIKDEVGATITEFAVVLPVFLMLMMGTFDAAHTIYMRSVMQGEVYRAARESALKAGGRAIVQAEIDEKLKNQIKALLPTDATIFGPTRANFSNYEDSGNFGLAEPYEDANDNGECDNGETYEDRNKNGEYDDRSADYVGTEKDQGGARDVVRYSVRVQYESFFPLPRSFGTRDITVESVIVNQPFDEQAAPETATCD